MKSTSKLIVIGLIASLLFTAAIVLAPTPAMAGTSVNCQPYSKEWATQDVFRTSANRTLPLRCGYWNSTLQKGWGVNKLKAKGRWNSWFRDMISVTLNSPYKHWPQNDTTEIFVTNYFKCKKPYRFRVVVNTTKKKGESYVMGVVNAYQEWK